MHIIIVKNHDDVRPKSRVCYYYFCVTRNHICEAKCTAFIISLTIIYDNLNQNDRSWFYLGNKIFRTGFK